MTIDTTERGLEERVCAMLTHRADPPDAVVDGYLTGVVRNDRNNFQR